MSASAKAIEVLPVPLGPRKSQPEGKGLSMKFASTFLGFSNPTNSETLRGRYLSARDCGNCSVLMVFGVLIGCPFSLPLLQPKYISSTVGLSSQFGKCVAGPYRALYGQINPDWTGP